MAGLNLAALSTLQEELGKRKGDGNMVFQKDLKAETDVRLLPTKPNMNGVYFMEQIVWWWNKKPYTSPLTLKEDCPIQAELDQALAYAKENNDKDLLKLLDKEKIKKQSQFHLPVLMLDTTDSDKVKVIDNKAKILVVGVTLIKAINKLVTSKVNQNGTEWGIMDRKLGINLILGRTGTTREDTEYSAQAYRYESEMPESYYNDLPDILQNIKANMKTDEWLVDAVRNYLYGEPMPKEDEGWRFPEARKAVSGDEVAEQSGSPRKAPPKTTEKAAPKPTAAKVEAERPSLEDEGTATAKATRKAPPPKAGTGTKPRNVTDDMNDM